MNRFYHICVPLLLAVFSSCALIPFPMTARLYDLETGNVIEGLIKDARQKHGITSRTNPKTGEKLTGEYATLSADRTSTSFGFGKTNISGQATNATSQLF